MEKIPVFSPLPTIFSKALFPHDRYNFGLCDGLLGTMDLGNALALSQTSPGFYLSAVQVF